MYVYIYIRMHKRDVKHVYILCRLIQMLETHHARSISGKTFGLHNHAVSHTNKSPPC